AQEATGMLAGTVTMVETGEPLEGVEVRLGETGRTAVTDENGEFLFMGVPVGTYELTTDRLATKGDAPVAATVEAGASSVVEIALLSEPIVVDPVEAEVDVDPNWPAGVKDFYRRANRGSGGTFITRADIEEQAPFSSSELLQNVPAIRLDCRQPGKCVYHFGRAEGKRRMQSIATRRNPGLTGRKCGGISAENCEGSDREFGARGNETPTEDRVAGGGRTFRPEPGECRPLHFVDGVPLAEFDLDDIHPNDIEGLEVYSPASVPAQFKRKGTDCGVIVIWTRVS
ncbi:MAG: carboxypeptidase regulatory-like domain-containing protein, partial [Gemmatimonadota bacterium]|nr:carboxypeptidase regulatory-like domain-containing protein [Gemmatimonadota bacterium]